MYFQTQTIKGSFILYNEQTDNDDTEPNISGPIDLVYLWVNGSDPKFILEMKRQKAVEDFGKYNKYAVLNYHYFVLFFGWNY
jgi:hypothetical protein